MASCCELPWLSRAPVSEACTIGTACATNVFGKAAFETGPLNLDIFKKTLGDLGAIGQKLFFAHPELLDDGDLIDRRVKIRDLVGFPF